MYVLLESRSGGVIDDVDTLGEALSVVRAELLAGGSVSTWALLRMGERPEEVREVSRGLDLQARAWSVVDEVDLTLQGGAAGSGTSVYVSTGARTPPFHLTGQIAQAPMSSGVTLPSPR